MTRPKPSRAPHPAGVVLPPLHGVEGIKIVKEKNLFVRVVADFEVDPAFPRQAARAAMRNFACDNYTDQNGNFFCRGLAVRELRPGERTIGYTAAVCRELDRRDEERSKRRKSKGLPR